MSSKTVILATGQAGAEICAALLEYPHVEVRGGVHTPGKEAMLPAGVHPVPLDTESPSTVKAAFEGGQS